MRGCLQQNIQFYFAFIVANGLKWDTTITDCKFLGELRPLKCLLNVKIILHFYGKISSPIFNHLRWVYTERELGLRRWSK